MSDVTEKAILKGIDSFVATFGEVPMQYQLLAQYAPGAFAGYGLMRDFVMRDHVPNEFVRVNPLGLQITYFRVDQAFEETRR